MKISVFALIISFALVCFNVPVAAQQVTTVKGKIVNPANEPLIGNVILLSAPDSAFVKGAAFTDGNFELAGINRKEFYLKFNSLQFPDTVIRVQYQGEAQMNLGTILVARSKYHLNEVQVVSNTPLVRYSNNGTVEVNVANTALASSNSVTEILTRSPNVLESEGRFSVFGKGEAIIYLNGKQITAERLASIPTSQIAKIEIIGNPSAKYDAEGKAVINVITKVKTEEGLMGTFNQFLTHSPFGGSNASSSLDLSYMRGRLSLVGNYSILWGDTKERLHTIRSRSAADDYMNSDLWTDWNRKMKNYSNYGLGAQYNFSEKSNISLAYSGYLEKMGGTTNSRNAIDNKTDKSYYTSGINKDDQRWNHSVTLNYNLKTDTLGSTLFIGTQYSKFNSDINDFIEENSVVNGAEGRRFLKNLVDHGISISTTQADYAKVFASGDRLEIGAKFSYVENSSGTNFFIGPDGSNFKRDSGLSNKFRYVEKIPAAYISYSGTFARKVNYSLGARGEWTNYDLTTSANSGQSLSDSYFNIFPNASVSATLTNKVKLRAAYSSRITRPRYQSLNPLVIYQDPFTTIEGNPNLIPEKTHSFEVGANYSDYDLKIGYNYTIDPIDAAALRGNTPNSYVLKAINLFRGHLYSATLSKSFSVRKWWSSVNSVSLNYLKQVDNKYNFELLTPKPQIYLYTSNTFTVPDLFRIQLLAWYAGDKYSGLYYDKHRATVTLGVERDFLRNKLRLKLLANDIFHSTASRGNYNVGKTYIFFDRTYSTNYFRFVLTYNFGKLTKTDFKNRTTGQSENNRAN